jgi:hypothetical protein
MLKDKMKKNSQFLIVLALALLTANSFGQGIASRAMPREQITFRPQLAEGGLICGSVTFPKEKALYNGYFFMVSAVTDDRKTWRKKSKEIRINPEQIFKMKHDGELDGGLTYLFILERPAGNYTINNVRLFTNGPFVAMQRDDNMQGFSIPFEVKKGEITYVGNILYNEYLEAGQKVVEFKNNYDRDIAELKRLQPHVLWNLAENDTTRTIEYK